MVHSEDILPKELYYLHKNCPCHRWFHPAKHHPITWQDTKSLYAAKSLHPKLSPSTSTSTASTTTTFSADSKHPHLHHTQPSK